MESLGRLLHNSITHAPGALRFLLDEVGAERVVFGSDYPFDMGVPDPLDRIEAAGLDEATVAAIAGVNASRLLDPVHAGPSTA